MDDHVSPYSQWDMQEAMLVNRASVGQQEYDVSASAITDTAVAMEVQDLFPQGQGSQQSEEKPVNVIKYEHAKEFSLSLTGWSPDDMIEVQCRRRDMYDRGVIRTVNEDGTCAIVYDDGSEESSVKPELIRLANVSREAHSGIQVIQGEMRTEFQLNDVIEAMYGGQDSWYPGKICRVRGEDGTYDIIYDDGDEESSVKPEFIRRC